MILKTTVGTREAYQQHLGPHLVYLGGLRARGVLLSAGTFDDRSGGMTLIETAGLEDALVVARQDPLVQRGVETYQVRGWVPTAGGPLERLDSGQLPLFDPSATGPIARPDAVEGFRVIDLSEHPRRDELRVRCFVPETIAADDPMRGDFLRSVAGRGLRKLLLLHEEQVAGQIEFCPPEASALAVAAPGATAVHCLWVVDAYTGLDGGRLLLAACAEQTKADALVTVAYNATLPWMPRTFFEKQGFGVVDQLDTGRYYESTPIVAYLLWRPLVPDAKPPVWDRARFLEGLTFCPAYPWMAGKRLYWGEEFEFTGVVVKEGLRRSELLSQLPILETRHSGNWTLIKFGVPEAALPRGIELLQAALIAEPCYYAHLSDGERMFIVYPDRVFRATTDRASWAEATRYGIDKGIPEEELVFDGQFPEDEDTARR